MKIKLQEKCASIPCALFCVFQPQLPAQVPNLVSHQGRVAVNGVNFNGSGQFKFALVNANGSTSYWSNDGTSSAGSEPAAAVTLPVEKSDHLQAALIRQHRIHRRNPWSRDREMVACSTIPTISIGICSIVGRWQQAVQEPQAPLDRTSHHRLIYSQSFCETRLLPTWRPAPLIIEEIARSLDRPPHAVVAR